MLERLGCFDEIDLIEADITSSPELFQFLNEVALLETWWRCYIELAVIIAQTEVDTASFLCCHHKSRRANEVRIGCQ
jgi:hypothetical protein